MAKKIGRGGELFAHLCDPEHLIQSARPAAGGKRNKVRLRGQVLPRGILLSMRSFTTVIECDGKTGIFVGYVPGWPGAHSLGATVDELRSNLVEVVAMLLEDGEPKLEAQFIGTEQLKVA